MLYMVIESFRDTDPIGERFARQGRMLPEGVTYHASWVEPSGAECFQLMETPDHETLKPWMSRWDDLIDFEIIAVLLPVIFGLRRNGRGTDLPAARAAKSTSYRTTPAATMQPETQGTCRLRPGLFAAPQSAPRGRMSVHPPWLSHSYRFVIEGRGSQHSALNEPVLRALAG